MAYREAKMILLLSDARGIYMPRDFANEVKRETVAGVSDEDWQILAEGPDHEWYWEAWEQFCNNAVITDPTDGTVYTIHQDGDCWLVEKGAEMNSGPTLAPDIDGMFVIEIPDTEESES